MTALTLSPDRPHVHVRTITGASCDICFGTGKIWAKPGVLVDCPNGCPSFTMTATAERPYQDPQLVGGCLACMCSAAACAAGCGCTCCCSYEPAVATAFSGGEGFLAGAAR